MWGSTKENSCPVILLIHLPSAQRRKKPLLGRAIIHIQTLFLAAVLTIQSRRFLCFGGNYSDLLGRRKAPLVPAPLPASANPIIAGSAVNDRAGDDRLYPRHSPFRRTTARAAQSAVYDKTSAFSSRIFSPVQGHNANVPLLKRSGRKGG